MFFTCTVWDHWETWLSRYLLYYLLLQPGPPSETPCLHLLPRLQLGLHLRNHTPRCFRISSSAASLAGMMGLWHCGLTARGDHKQQDSSLSPLISSSARQHTVSVWAQLWWRSNLSDEHEGSKAQKLKETTQVYQDSLCRTGLYVWT